MKQQQEREGPVGNPLPSKSLRVAQMLEKAILTGQLRPGTRLPEIRLARELGVSQSSVREALLALESTGLVTRSSNRGSAVIQVGTPDLIAIFQVRQELEPLACFLAAGLLTESMIHELRECLRAMLAAAETGDYRSFQDADLRFHRTIWRVQPNRPLERCLESICLPLFAYDLVRRYATSYTHFERSARQHELVLAALLTGDPQRAARVMRRMIRRWLWENLRDYEQLPESAAEADDDPFAFLRGLDRPPARATRSC